MRSDRANLQGCYNNARRVENLQPPPPEQCRVGPTTLQEFPERRSGGRDAIDKTSCPATRVGGRLPCAGVPIPRFCELGLSFGEQVRNVSGSILWALWSIGLPSNKARKYEPLTVRFLETQLEESFAVLARKCRVGLRAQNSYTGFPEPQTLN